MIDAYIKYLVDVTGQHDDWNKDANKKVSQCKEEVEQVKKEIEQMNIELQNLNNIQELDSEIMTTPQEGIE